MVVIAANAIFLAALAPMELRSRYARTEWETRHAVLSAAVACFMHDPERDGRAVLGLAEGNMPRKQHRACEPVCVPDNPAP